MLGFPYMKNFDQPYMATSISGFWRRWHITLGAWFRDYVYIPLGGNRKGAFRNVCNLACVWLLTGLWHGNGINFVIWGLTVGLLIVLEKLVYGRWMSERKILSHLYVWFLIPLTWMVFAIEDVNQMGVYFGRLFPFFGIGETLNEREIFQYFETYGILMFASLICCVPALEKLYQKWKHKLFVSLFLLILFWIAVYKAVNMANNPFM
jgi:alginate O-acetyltransferase complex protein AlgI